MAGLRVLVVSLSRPPHDARAHYRQVTTLLQRGHEVTYVAPFAAFGLVGEDGHLVPDFSDVDAVDVPLARRHHRLRSVRAAARELELDAPRTDVVIAHDAVLVPALLRLRRRHPGLAVVWDVRDDPAPQCDPGLRVPRRAARSSALPRRQRIAAAATRRLDRHAERHLHLTLAEPELAARFEHRHPVFPDTVRVPPEPPEGRRPEHRVVALGAVTPERGMDDLLALAERLAPDVRVQLVGPAAPHLDAQLRARTAGTTVDYTGFQQPRLALEHLQGALAGVSLPRAAPGVAPSPRADVVTHLAYGLPVVTTPDPSTLPVVEESGACFVVPVGDVDAAAEHVRKLLTDHSLRVDVGRRAWEAARRSWDWNLDGARFADQVEAWAEQARQQTPAG